jgi:hypothetical protein
MAGALRSRSFWIYSIATEAHMTLKRFMSHVMSGLAAVLIAFAIFITLTSIGVISRPSSEGFSFEG